MWWEVDLLTLRTAIKNHGDDCKLHTLIILMVCVLPHTFHWALSGSRESPASIRKVIQVQIRKTPSAWVSLWSHLHRKAEIP